MLDWLKGILGDAYTSEMDSAISAEIGRGFVAKADFNSVKARLKEITAQRDDQLVRLQATTAQLQRQKAQLAALLAANEQTQRVCTARLEYIRLHAAVDKALLDAGARNIVAAKALLGEFLAHAKAEADGSVCGLCEQIKVLAEDPHSAFLFEAWAGWPNGMDGTASAQTCGEGPYLP